MQQTTAKHVPDLAEEPRSAEAEIVQSVQESLGRVISHTPACLGTLDGPDIHPASAHDTLGELASLVACTLPTAYRLGVPRRHPARTTYPA